MPAGLEQPARRADGPLLVLATTLLALAAWSGSLLRAGFSFDDAEAVHGNPVVEGSVGWTAAFGRDYWDHLAPAGQFRPLATLSLRLDRAWHGDAPAGWHLTNVLLHAAVVALAGLLLLLLVPAGPSGPVLPWLGLALLAVHPVLADSVAWISGRTSMLSALPGLAGALALMALGRPQRPASGPRLALAALAAALGLAGALSGKEDGIVFAAVYLLIGLRSARRLTVAVALGCCAGLLAYLTLRARALGSPWPSAPHAPLAGEPLAGRLLVAGRALLELTRLAALPLGYPPSYDRAAYLRADTIASAPASLALALLGWAPWVALLAASARALRRAPTSLVAWSGTLAALSLLPVLQLVPAGAILAPRFLYLPLLLAVPLVHRLGELVRPWLPRWALGALLAAGLVGAWQRAGVYASRASFHQQVLALRPADAPAWNELGLAHEEAGDVGAARAAYAHAIALDPELSRPWSNLGRLQLAAGDFPDAERLLRRAAELGPRNPLAQLNLGALLLRQGRPDEAIPSYLRALALAPRLQPAWRGLGRARLEAGRPAEARQALERALELDPSDGASRRLLALARER